jgi:hypothetical protein
MFDRAVLSPPPGVDADGENTAGFFEMVVCNSPLM